MSELLTTTDIKLLIARGEDSKTERKQELHYSRSKAEEAEFIMDLMGLVNAIGDGSSYVLIGVEDKTDICHDVTSLGLREENMQQFVRHRIEPTLRFSYREYEYEGVNIGIIDIPRSRTRFHLASKTIHDDKKKVLLEQGMIYLRDGTSKRPINASDFTLLRNEIEAQVRLGLERHLEIDRPELIVSFKGAATDAEAELDQNDWLRQVLSQQERSRFDVPIVPRVPVEFYVRNIGSNVARIIKARATFPPSCRLKGGPSYYGHANYSVEGESQNILSVNMNGPLIHRGEEEQIAYMYLVVPKSGETYEVQWTAICEGMKTEASGTLRLHIARDSHF